MFTTKIIENEYTDILYIKELNNYMILDKNGKSQSGGKKDKNELLNIALDRSEKEFMRWSKIIDSWENMDCKKNNPSLYTLCLHPVRKCNYECKYCYAEKSDYLPCGEITIETAKKAIDFMMDEWGKDAKRYVVDISGSGEPLLRMSFIKELEEYCEAKRKEKNRDIKIMFPTNGALISKENAEYLQDSFNILVGVSIDGNEQQNSNRKSKNNQSAFEMTARGIDLLKNRNVGLAATITQANENVDEVYDFLYHRFANADAISLNVVRDYEKNSPTSFYNINMDNLLYHYRLLLDKIYENVCNNNYEYIKKLLIGTDTLGIYLNRVFSKGLLNKKRCGAVSCILSVDEKGNLYACSVVNGNQDFKVGDIYRGIDEERKNLFANINNESNKYCKECWAANICAGECLATSYLTHGTINAVNSDLCNYRKELISLALQFATSLELNNPTIYNNIMKIVQKRKFFEYIIDSGIWAVQEYLKLNNVDANYSEVLSSIKSTDFGTVPSEIIKALGILSEDVDAYEISDLQQLENIEYPVIAFINKMKLGYYEYALITGIGRDNVYVKKAFKEETMVIPIDVFINEISDIIICRKII